MQPARPERPPAVRHAIAAPARALVATLALALAGGHAAHAADTPAPAAPTPTAAPTARPDWPHARLEVLAAAGKRTFAIDVADTPDRQELGLMNVRMLPAGLGMLFPVEPVRGMQMWMKNTYIPLDMLFIDDSGRIACVRERTTPLSLAIVDCPQPSRYVLEIAGGEARRLGIRAGDKVAYPVDRP
jgi:uncharacterized membrane protein (UPF0127 family)